MATLYLTEQGSVLKKTYKRLLIEKNREKLLEVPEFKVDRILIFGNVQITTQAINFLLDKGIDTSFLSINGRLRGKLSAIESKNIYLRIAQFQKNQDENFKVNLAKIIVDAKIKNSISLINKYTRNHPEVNLSNYVKDLKKIIISLNRKENISTIFGIEGLSSAIYFEAYGKMFRKEIQFKKRSRRPPADPINSLLSLGYTLIANEIFSIVAAIGFDPYIGYLHSIDYGRPSLVLDLIEEFRQPIIDVFTLHLVNKKILDESDFEEKENKGFYLREESKKKYFMYYERMIIKKENNFRKHFQIQAHKFANTILKNVPYVPFRVIK